MQAVHVGNLGDLYAKGKAYTAGPLGDNGFIRGIVVVNAGSLKEVQDCFKPDPYVQKGFMDAPAYLWNTDITKFGVPQYPFSIGLHSIAFVKKGKMWGEHQI